VGRLVADDGQGHPGGGADRDRAGLDHRHRQYLLDPEDPFAGFSSEPGFPIASIAD
jgi:hypothetical protein